MADATTQPSTEVQSTDSARHDPRTRDGKPLYMIVAITNYVLQVNKDEKFIQFAVATDVRDETRLDNARELSCLTHTPNAD